MLGRVEGDFKEAVTQPLGPVLDSDLSVEIYRPEWVSGLVNE